MTKNIVVVGSSNTDMIIKLERIPRPGETVLGGEFSIAPGGKGANQAVSAARAGGNVVFIARVGDDIFGEKAVKGFIQDGINVNYIIPDKNAPSGVALIFVDKKGENSIAVAPGSNANLSPDNIKKASDVMAESLIMLIQLEIPIETVKTAVEVAYENKVSVILNPAPAQQLDDDLLKKIDIITPNETEVEILTGIKIEDGKSIEKAGNMLLEKGIKTVLITIGKRGVYVINRDFKGIISSFDVKPVDTTAAGDVFNGVLAVALSENMSLKDAVRFSNAAAALSVTKLGAQTSAPFRAEIDSFLRERDACFKT
jgi:ribokinase